MCTTVAFSSLALATALAVGSASAQSETPLDRGSFPVLSVHVVGVTELAAGLGVDSAGLRRQVERQLVRAGFRLADPVEREIDPEIPRLVVNVGLFTTRDSSTVYSILLELVELVRIKRNGLETHAVNWSEQVLGIAPRAESGSATRGATAALVDLFLKRTQATTVGGGR